MRRLLKPTAEDYDQLWITARYWQQEAERLRAALKPFADYADPTGKVPAPLVISAGSPMAKRQLTMGDCYKASHVLGRKDAES